MVAHVVSLAAALILVSTCVETTVATQPPFSFSWDKISTYAFPGKMNRYFTEAELQHFSQFSLLLYWGINVQPDPSRGTGWWIPDQEANTIRQAAAIKAINPDILLFPYITGFMAQTWFQAQWQFDQPEHSSWWLTDPATGTPIDCNNTKANVCYGYSQGAPGKLYDWRIPAVRDYFVNEVIAPYVDNENISGIFLDDTTDVADRCLRPPHGTSPCTGSWTFTIAEQLDFTNATLIHLEATLESMRVHGKTAIVSTEVDATSTPLNSSTFDKMLEPYGAMHFNEFFEGSQTDIVSALATTSTGGAFIVHASGPNTVGAFEQREYPLAAFLIIAGEYSYWGMGGGWSVGSFPWYPEFNRPLGKPLGAATEIAPGEYFRAFEALNVTVNTNLRQASIQWHGLGPIPGPTPPPPSPPFGKYSATAQVIVHQNPPSYSQTKNVKCAPDHTSAGYAACVNASATICDTTPSCTAFSVLSPSYGATLFGELSPKPTSAGQSNVWWTTYQKASPTPGSWHNTSRTEQ